MKTILKYTLYPGQVPIREGKVVAVGFQFGNPTAWVEHDDAFHFGNMSLEIVPTGVTFSGNGQHVGSAISDAYVWHVYATKV